MSSTQQKAATLTSLKTSVDKLFSSISSKKIAPQVTAGELLKTVGFCQHEFLPSDVRELLKFCYKADLKYTESQETLIKASSDPSAEASKFTLSLNEHLYDLEPLTLAQFGELILQHHGLRVVQSENKNENSSSISVTTNNAHQKATTAQSAGNSQISRGSRLAASNKTAQTALRVSLAKVTEKKKGKNDNNADKASIDILDKSSSTSNKKVKQSATFESLFLLPAFAKIDVKSNSACAELLTETEKELSSQTGSTNRPAARDQDLMYRGLQLTLRDTQKSLKATSASIERQQSTIDTTRRLSEDLDRKWEAFEEKFQEVNTALVRRIARSLGARVDLSHKPNNNTSKLENNTQESISNALTSPTTIVSHVTGNNNAYVEPRADNKRPDEKCAIGLQKKKHAKKSLDAIGDHESFVRRLADARNIAAKSSSLKRSARGSATDTLSMSQNNNAAMSMPLSASARESRKSSLNSGRRASSRLGDEFECIEADAGVSITNRVQKKSSKLPLIPKSSSKKSCDDSRPSSDSSSTTSSEKTKITKRNYTASSSIVSGEQKTLYYIIHPKVLAADLVDEKMRYAVSAKLERDFPALPKAQSGDWLSEHSEVGQSVETFIKRCNGMFAKPSMVTNTLYIQPLGTVNPKKAKTLPAGVKNVELLTEKNSEFLKLLKSYLEAFFGGSMVVKILPFETVEAESRHHDYDGRYQIHAGNIIHKAIPRLRLKHRDAYAFIGITMEDLYPRDSWNFVFGLADMMGRNGVFSFARYDDDDEYDVDYNFAPKNRSGDQNEVPRLQERDPLRFARLLKRACKVMTHELCHCFGVKHCVHFNCLMQGSNNSEEAEKKLHDLCPCCLKKILYACEFDPVARYKKLQDWCDDRINDGKEDMSIVGENKDFNCFDHIFGEWSQWYGRRIEAICEKIIATDD